VKGRHERALRIEAKKGDLAGLATDIAIVCKFKGTRSSRPVIGAWPSAWWNRQGGRSTARRRHLLWHASPPDRLKSGGTCSSGSATAAS